MKTPLAGSAGPLLISIVLLRLLSPEGIARTDALDHWTPSQVVTNGLGTQGFSLTGLAYGNGRYVAVGQYIGADHGAIQTSDDGLSWTSRDSGAYSILNLYDVAYGNGVFVAVGWDWFGGNNIYFSTNGVDWTSRPTAIANFYRVIYGGSLFVAVGDGLLLQTSSTTNRNIYTSPDGFTWTARNAGSPVNDVPSLSDVAYGSGRFVAVDSAHHFYTSSTGSSWSRIDNSNAGNRVNFCNGLFIVPSSPGINLVSTDGLAWSLLTNSTAASFGRVSYAQGCYLALSGPNVFTSTDGTNWSQRAAQIPSNVSLGAVAYNKDVFLTVGFAYPPLPITPVVYVSDPIVAVKIDPGLPPRLKVSGLVGRSYRIEQRDDLRAGNWQPAATFILANSPSTWTDPQATNASRVYRAVLLP